jgi:hypothetical protein
MFDWLSLTETLYNIGFALCQSVLSEALFSETANTRCTGTGWLQSASRDAQMRLAAHAGGQKCFAPDLLG